MVDVETKIFRSKQVCVYEYVCEYNSVNIYIYSPSYSHIVISRELHKNWPKILLKKKGHPQKKTRRTENSPKKMSKSPTGVFKQTSHRRPSHLRPSGTAVGWRVAKRVQFPQTQLWRFFFGMKGSRIKGRPWSICWVKLRKNRGIYYIPPKWMVYN